VNLRRRLQALEEARQRARAGHAPEPPRKAPASAELSVQEAAVALVGRQRTLEDLRRRMAEILARPTPVPRAVEPSGVRMPLEELPFVRRDTDAGVLYQRVEGLPASHRVGTVGLEAALGASAEALALLAFDEAIAAASPRGFLFLDIETTGLGGAGSLAFLVGLASFDASGKLFVEQLLLDRPGNERALLERVRERVASAELVVSFNGKAFDQPMLAARFVMNRLPPPAFPPHLDLLHVGRRLHRRRLSRCTLKHLESEVLGFVRGEDIDGHEVATRYVRYLQTGDAAGLAAVIDHNYWDVVSMVAFVGLYGQPLPELAALDLASLARTLKRAGAPSRAIDAADLACRRGGGVEALRIRAELAKGRGDVDAALRDFELICAQADDPRSRLELAKLYEHRLRRPDRALYWVELGTSETALIHERRRSRLARKVGQAGDPRARANLRSPRSG
jgi:hypothetical protein